MEINYSQISQTLSHGLGLAKNYSKPVLNFVGTYINRENFNTAYSAAGTKLSSGLDLAKNIYKPVLDFSGKYINRENFNIAFSAAGREFSKLPTGAQAAILGAAVVITAIVSLKIFSSVFSCCSGKKQSDPFTELRSEIDTLKTQTEDLVKLSLKKDNAIKVLGEKLEDKHTQLRKQQQSDTFDLKSTMRLSKMGRDLTVKDLISAINGTKTDDKKLGQQLKKARGHKRHASA